MPFPIIPIIAAIGAIAAAGISRNAQRRSNESNERLAREQNERNQENWREQNEYNDPAAQMARLQNAGLNPNYIYGSSSNSATGNAGDVKGYDRADNESEMRGFQGFGEFTNSFREQAQTDNIKAQTDLANTEKLLKAEDILKRSVETANISEDVRLKKGLYDSSVEFKKGTVDKLFQENRLATANAEVAEGTKSAKIKLITYDVKHAMATLKGQQLQNELQKITNQMAKDGISWSDSMLMRQLQKQGLTIDALRNFLPNNPLANPKNWGYKN